MIMRLAQLLPPVVVGLGLSAVAQEPALQVDWIQSPYSLTWYGLEYTPRSWTDSELLAVSIGGHLGTIRSQAEQDWVGQQFLHLPPAGTWPYSLWIGGTDQVVDNNWEWASGEIWDCQLFFCGWGGSEPSGGGGEDYASMITDTHPSLSPGDWNDDHDSKNFRGVLELPTEPNVGWSWPRLVSTTTRAVHGALADLNGDGALDYASANQMCCGGAGGTVNIHMNDGSGTFESPQTIAVPAGSAFDVIAVDHDQDGDLDLIATFKNNGVFLIENDQGTFSFHSEIVGPDSLAWPQGVRSLDVNGDSIPDIAVAEGYYGNKVRIFHGQPGGGFVYGGDLVGLPRPDQIEVGDFNQDGLQDIVVAGGTTSPYYVRLYLGSPAGVLVPGVSLPFPDVPAKPACADFTGDGALDLLVSAGSPSSGELSVWKGDGAGGFSLHSSMAVSNNFHCNAVGDLDGDGDIDLCAPINGQSQYRVYWNDGSGTFGPYETLSGLAESYFALVGNLDGRAAPDLVLVNHGQNLTEAHFIVHLNNRSRDCNGNGVPDDEDIANGMPDCNGNGIPDYCDMWVYGTSTDCNANNTPDECDIANDPSLDCDQNGEIDSCDPNPSDCNGNGTYDPCDIQEGTSLDCNGNWIPAECDIAGGASGDCNGNGIPDECEEDCNGNGIPDECEDIVDCNANGIPDECEGDCNGNGIPDDCDIGADPSLDCDLSGTLDSCDVVEDPALDCDSSGSIDSCEIANDPSLDCDGNGTIDTCDLGNDPSLDCDSSGTLDSCELAGDPSLDCDGNGTIDTCDLAGDPSLDCDQNGSMDSCELAADPLLDCDGSGGLDACELDDTTDCDGNEVLDSCEIADDPALDLNGNGVLDSCECPHPSTFCVTTPNSAGPPGALIGSVGLPSISVNAFTLSASSAPPGQPGIFYYGPGQIQVPFGDGVRCVGGGPTFRLPPIVIAGNGRASYHLDFTQPPSNAGPGEIAPMDTWNFQFWYRDPANPNGLFGFNLSNGLEVTFCP
ncbi:MAG: hypothetical protein CMJ84_18930 [Planctomycetes bacterium]|nr:hypothetical protein [Planctomycetota bacterium]